MFDTESQQTATPAETAPTCNDYHDHGAEAELPVIEMLHGSYEFLYRKQDGIPGLYWRENKEKGHVDHFISSPVTVIAQVRDMDSTGWGRLISYIDQDGIERTYTIRFANISRDSEAIIGALRDRGLFITSSGHARKLVDFIHNVKVEKKMRTTDLAGWHEGSVFVLPGRTIGNTGEDLVFSNDNLKLKPFLLQGSLENWQEHVAIHCIGNNVLAFATSIAFAAPLLNIIHQENGGFNLMGNSSIGKSTAMAIATSVFGSPKDAVQKWNMTINSLEGVAKAFNDFMLPLDEIGQSTPHQIGEIVYMLGNGTGKGRANVHGEARKRVNFRTLFLSNGEKTLEEHMGEASKKVKAGQEVRLVDFPANCDLGYGIYQDIKGCENSRAFNDTLLHNTKLYYGTAFDAYLREVIVHIETLPQEIKRLMDSFMKQNVPNDASGQVMRIATRFALVSAAGTLATRYGVTGWPEDEAGKAVRFCFNKWLTQRGTVVQSETTRLLLQVQAFFEAYGESRFTHIGPCDTERTVIVRDRVGFKERHDGNYRYFVLPQQLNQIIAGFNKTSAIKTLVAQGIIVPGNNGKSQVNKRLPGFKDPKKVYEFSSKVLAEEEDDATDKADHEGNMGNEVTGETD